MVSDAWGLGTEIWHDYVSVPQWSWSKQQEMLRLLPQIYAKAERTIVHLHDVQNSSIDLLFSEVESRDRQHGIRDILAGKWFERMWVCVEWAQSCRIHPLTQDHVLRQDTDDLFWGKIQDVWNHELSLNQLEEIGFLYNHRLETGKASLRNAPEFYDGPHFFNMRMPHTVAASLDVQRRAKICLGEAINIMAERHCREWHDRYVALLGFTGVGLDGSQLPEDSTKACLALASKCLMGNDYSPLLLIPGPKGVKKHERETTGYSPSRPEWLKCYAYMDYLSFVLGAEVSSAHHRPICAEVNGSDSPKIVLRLQPIGVVHSVMYHSFNHEDFLAFGRLLRFVLALTETEQGHEESFVTNLLTRCYGLPTDAVLTFLAEDPSRYADFRRLLGCFRDHPAPNIPFYVSWSFDHLDIAWLNADLDNEHQRASEFARVLGLSTEVLRSPIIRYFERHPLYHAQHGGADLHKWTRGAVGSEIAFAQCEHCGQQSAYRLGARASKQPVSPGTNTKAQSDKDVLRGAMLANKMAGKLPQVRGSVERQNSLIRTHLYRIPGLRYKNVPFENSVGIAVRDGRVIGRMVYAVKACTCHADIVMHVELV